MFSFLFQNKDRSPFFRLLNDCAKKAPSAVTELNFQYRSPPHIMHWVDEFYNIKCKPRVIPPPVSKLKIKSLFVFDLIVPADDEIKFVLDKFIRHFNSACTFLDESVSEKMILEFSELYLYRSLMETGNLTILDQIICSKIVVTTYSTTHTINLVIAIRPANQLIEPY